MPALELEPPIPDVLRRVADLMSRYPGSWALCGGWAVDAWLGRQTRTHGDVDLAIFEHDQLALREYLADGWLLNGHDAADDEGKQAWDGRRLAIPAHVHAYAEDFDLDFQLIPRMDERWAFDGAGRITRPVHECIRPSPWGLPTLVPEAVLLYKALGDVRTQDQADFEALQPLLTGSSQIWLRRALETLRPSHDWLPSLGSV